MKDPQKKVPSVHTYPRLPLVNNWAVACKSPPAGSTGRQYLKCLAQAISFQSFFFFFCYLFPVTPLLGEHFPGLAASLSSSKKLVLIIGTPEIPLEGYLKNPWILGSGKLEENEEKGCFIKWGLKAKLDQPTGSRNIFTATELTF